MSLCCFKKKSAAVSNTPLSTPEDADLPLAVVAEANKAVSSVS